MLEAMLWVNVISKIGRKYLGRSLGSQLAVVLGVQNFKIDRIIYNIDIMIMSTLETGIKMIKYHYSIIIDVETLM